KDAVWSDWDRFAKDADALQEAAAQLAKAVAANDQGAVRKYVGEVGKTCKSCHDQFKLKKGG
ncbi:MAG TPA: cytochrome c, partial [Steroidobacteraceae bacterium]